MAMKVGPFQFQIGQGKWAEEIRYYTRELNPDYWQRFTPLSAADIARIERNVGRTLPEDFREFLRVFGWGEFPEPYGGIIYGPEDFELVCHGHLSMVMGSARWASGEDQKRFYVTRGAFNPNPEKYTEDALLLDGVNLLDLLQFGIDGLASYHQVYVGQAVSELGYCLLTVDPTIEDAAPSFSEGLKTILTKHWNRNEPPEELPPEWPFSFELE